MKVGLIVDGQAEFHSLPHIAARLGTPHQVLNPVFADIQPHATPGQIALAARSRLVQLAGRGVDRAIVLLDRETRSGCPAQLAAELHPHIERRAREVGIADVSVVIKDRTFENWLISDPEALIAQPKRYSIPEKLVTTVRAGQADNLDALDALQRAAIRNAFHKVEDAVRILGLATPTEMAIGSRSFRRFLRCVEHPSYCEQSRRPQRQ